VLDPRDEDAKRPDEDEFGPVAKAPKLAVMVEVLPLIRWLRNKFSKREVKQNDDNR